jgi:hypothetical protein
MPIYQTSTVLEAKHVLTTEDMEAIRTFFATIFPQTLPFITSETAFTNRYIKVEPDNIKQLVYRGVYNKDRSFETDNILFITNTITKQQKVSVSLSQFSADRYLYVTLQIAHYLEHKTFLPKEALYSTIFDAYNKNYVE